MVDFGGLYPSSSDSFLMDRLVICFLLFYTSPGVLRLMEK